MLKELSYLFFFTLIINSVAFAGDITLNNTIFNNETDSQITSYYIANGNEVSVFTLESGKKSTPVSGILTSAQVYLLNGATLYCDFDKAQTATITEANSYKFQRNNEQKIVGLTIGAITAASCK